MNICTIIKPNLITFSKYTEKEKTLNELIDLINKEEKIKDITSIRKKIFYREGLMSTGIGLSIGIPHIRIAGIDKPIIAIAVQPNGIKDYESIDNLPVKLIVMIICGEKQHKTHIKILSQIVSLLKKNDNITKVIKSENSSEVFKLFTGK